MLIVVAVLLAVSTGLVGPITFLGLLVTNLARGSCLPTSTSISFWVSAGGGHRLGGWSAVGGGS